MNIKIDKLSYFISWGFEGTNFYSYMGKSSF